MHAIFFLIFQTRLHPIFDKHGKDKDQCITLVAIFRLLDTLEISALDCRRRRIGDIGVHERWCNNKNDFLVLYMYIKILIQRAFGEKTHMRCYKNLGYKFVFLPDFLCCILKKKEL